MPDIEVIHGDCLSVMRGMAAGSFSLVITSPPYNLGNTSGGGPPAKGSPKGHYSESNRLGKRGGVGKWSGGALAGGYGDYQDDMPHEEYVAWQKEILTECWRLLTDDGAIFYNHKPRVINGVLVTPFDYVPAGLSVRQVIIWARAGGVNFSPAFYVPTHEWIVIIAKPAFRLRDKAASGMGDVWMFPQRADLRHPAPFPIELPTRILKTTRAGDVLDPFAGSGTVGCACAKAGRNCTLIEVNPCYIPLIRLRTKEAETPLFDTAGRPDPC